MSVNSEAKPAIWLQVATAKAHFMANFQSSGAIVAAPSQSHPDYFYHWVRDAAISMKSFYGQRPSRSC